MGRMIGRICRLCGFIVVMWLIWTVLVMLPAVAQVGHCRDTWLDMHHELKWEGLRHIILGHQTSGRQIHVYAANGENNEGGPWAAVAVDPVDGEACVLEVGKGFAFVGDPFK